MFMLSVSIVRTFVLVKRRFEATWLDANKQGTVFRSAWSLTNSIPFSADANQIENVTRLVESYYLYDYLEGSKAV